MKSSKLIILNLFFILFNPNYINAKDLKKLFPPQVAINQGIIDELLAGDIYSDTILSEKPNKNSKKPIKQKLFIFVAGLHPQKCSQSFPKISLLTNYKNYLSSFVKESIYNHEKKSFTLFLDHIVLPFKMSVTVFVEYPKEIKDYPFEMRNGLFKDLKGTIFTRPYKKKCLFYLTSNWEGPKYFNSTALELFSETLTKLGLKLLFRKTS